MRFFGKKPKAETLPEKFARLQQFHADMAASTRSAIVELKRQNQPALLIENYSHLVHDHCEIAVMLWRRGDDPRAAVATTHQAWREMIECWDAVDPNHQLPMSAIAGITDWDLVHSLFWLSGTPEPVRLDFPRLLEERYFAYSRFLLHRVTGSTVPSPLADAIDRFQAGAETLVDLDFRDKLALLESDPTASASEALIARIEARWPKRRNSGFYRTSAPLNAGHDVSNDLSVDHQLACILHLKGLTRERSPHAWRWG